MLERNIDSMGVLCVQSTIYEQTYQLLEFSKSSFKNMKYPNPRNKVEVLVKIINGIFL